eukprot:456894_1
MMISWSTMSHSNIFIQLKCPQRFNTYLPKAHHNLKNKDVLIISTSHHELDQKGIYEYNLTENTLTKIYTYKQTFEASFHGQFIDSKNELLYVFGKGTFGIFDLNTKIMNTKTQSALRDC